MKKLLFAALFALSIASSAFASGTNLTASVLNNFKTDFRNASNVSWVSKDDFAKATFLVDNVKMEAFYTAEGELIGTAKTLGMQDIPVNARRAFAKKYAGYTVKEVILFTDLDGSAFYFSAENNSESVIFKVSQNQQLTTFKRTGK